jgi:hypothetical protein
MTARLIDPHGCLNCGIMTRNPKFCSRNCAAKLNGKLYPKKTKGIIETYFCILCTTIVPTSTQKFCRACRRVRKSNPLEVMLTENSKFDATHLKRRLIREGILENNCSICSLGSPWEGKELVFIIDHINGIHSDNSLINLRLVCPNCNSQLPTFAGKNRPYKVIV